jgi:AcrR family transcriptional regulator
MDASMKPDLGELRESPAGAVAPRTGDRRAWNATKGRILDAAESLFMVHGYEATSLRAITAAAAVNLAAVHYHFGSKEELFQSVLARRLDPMNRARLDVLTRLEAEAAPKPLSCERVLTAFLTPALTLARDPERGGKDFLRLLGRAYADPAPFIRHFLAAQYGVTIARFKAAFARALPKLPARELSWRFHFIMGALSYTLAGTDALKLIAELNPHETANDEVLLRRLAPFLLAGLTAPLPAPDAVAHSADGEPAHGRRRREAASGRVR